jgi:hypothetical protein
MRHELKSWPEYFERIADGTRTFELRKDDRGGFHEGDIVLLREWDPNTQTYTGRSLSARISYVLRDHCAALPAFDGHVVFSLSYVQMQPDLSDGMDQDD